MIDLDALRLAIAIALLVCALGLCACGVTALAVMEHRRRHTGPQRRGEAP